MPSITQFRPELLTRLCTVYVEPTASIVGITPVVSLFLDRQGRVIQWYGLTVDIDEGKRADQLRRSEASVPKPSASSLVVSAGRRLPRTSLVGQTFQILEYDPSVRPTIERVLQRIHPDDLAMTRQFFDDTHTAKRISTIRTVC